MNLSFIGFGNLAKAIASGLATHSEYSLSASAPSLSIGVTKEGIKTHNDNKQIIHNAHIIILAVKPTVMRAVLHEIVPILPKGCLLLSVAAGLNFAWFASLCAHDQALIRSMPNTPAAIGLGATPLIANQWASSAQKECAEQIFATLGITCWANNEEDLDSFTALSGSGPAYVFYFMEALIKGAVALGLSEADARIFTLQTLKGTVALAEQSTLSMHELRAQVTSPKGTTAAAMTVLEPQFSELLESALKAAKIRALELASIY